MIDLWCVVDFGRRHWGRGFVRSTASDADPAAGLVQEVLLDEPEIVMAGRRRADQGGSVVVGSQSLVVLGTVCEDLETLFGAGGFDWNRFRTRPPDGFYQLLLWDAQQRVLKVAGDVMGARQLYYCELDGAWLLSTTLRPFRQRPGGRPALDGQAVAETLALCHALDDRTLLAGVRQVPAASILCFSAQGLCRETRRTAWSELHTPAAWSVRESADALEGALERAVGTWTRGRARVSLALTGGADSRLLLPFVRRQCSEVEACTFGDPVWPEVQIASQLGRQAGVEHRVCALDSAESLTGPRLAAFALETEWFGDSAGPFYWQPWLRFLRAQAVPMLSGFLGNAIVAPFANYPTALKDCLADRADAAYDEVARFGALQAQPLVPYLRSPGQEGILRPIGQCLADAYASAPGEQVSQRLVALNLAHRQRRYISWFPAVCDQAVGTLHPFLSAAVIETCTRMPLSSVTTRAAVVEVLRRRQPEALQLADSNTGRQLVHDSRWAFWVDAARRNRYTYRLAALTGKPDRRVLPTFNKWIRLHQPQILEELAQPNPALSEFVDLSRVRDAVIGGRGLGAYPLMRLFNVSAFTRWFYA